MSDLFTDLELELQLSAAEYALKRVLEERGIPTATTNDDLDHGMAHLYCSADPTIVEIHAGMLGIPDRGVVGLHDAVAVDPHYGRSGDEVGVKFTGGTYHVCWRPVGQFLDVTFLPGADIEHVANIAAAVWAACGSQTS